MDPRECVGSTSRATTSTNTNTMNVTFKRWDEINTDIKFTYVICPINEDNSETIVYVLHNDEAYTQVAVRAGGGDCDDLHVRLEPLPSLNKHANTHTTLFMPKYSDIMAALPSDYDLLIEE